MELESLIEMFVSPLISVIIQIKIFIVFFYSTDYREKEIFLHVISYTES